MTREYRLHLRAGPSARRRGHEKGDTARDESDGREALGRSRGGLITKIHLLAHQHSAPGSGHDPPAFDRVAYRDRNTVERAINLLKQNRAVATRYDKRTAIYDGTVQVASIRIWLRDLTRSKNTT